MFDIQSQEIWQVQKKDSLNNTINGSSKMGHE